MGIESIIRSGGAAAQDGYPIRRVVSLQPSATVTLRDLGALDRLVACTKYCLDVCPEVRGQAIVADSWTAKSQEIVARQPDLVIASVPYQLEAVAEILKAGCRFLGLAPHCLNDVFADIAAIGRMLDSEAGATTVVANMQQEIERIRVQTEGLPRPRVFCEEWGKPIICSQRWVAEMVETAGGAFVGEPGSEITAEAVAAKDPQIIVAAWCGAGDRVPLEKVVAQRGWEGLKAVAKGRVYCIRDEYLNTPASTLLQGLRALAWAIHPERFPKPGGIRQIQIGRERVAT